MSTENTTVASIVTPETIIKVKKSRNPVIDRTYYVDGQGNRLNVILRKRTAKKAGTVSYRVSAVYRVGRETVVGAKSTHTDEASARKAFEAIKAKVVSLGWKVRTVEVTVKNPDGYFTLDTLPKVDQKASAIAALKASVAKSTPVPAAKADGKTKK